MTQQSFLIEEKEYEKRLATLLQHKLRIVVRCYTILNLEIDYDNHTFNFSKSHWIKGFRMDDPKTYNGKYVANKQDGGKIELTIYV